jgi:hypothetical protein
VRNLIIGVLLSILGQVLAFFQLQGPIKYVWLKNNTWFSVLMGIPISYIFLISISNLVRAYDGALWPSRIIGFSIGTIMYGIMAKLIFDEKISSKTGICLSLAVLIILIQVFWKE